MQIVTVSPKFQVVIPKKVRQSLRLRPGQKMQVVEYDGRIEFIPARFVFSYALVVLILIVFLFPPCAGAQSQHPARLLVIAQNEYTGEADTANVDEEAAEKLRRMTPEEIKALDKKLAEALVLYYDRKFASALTIFKEIADEVETMDIMFWLGTSAMKVGDTKLAIAKFRQMLESDSILHRVRLDLAWAYFNLGRYDEAKKELETVEKARPPKAVQKNIEKLLAAIKQQTKELSWNIRFSQGIMYDTNVSAGPSERELEVSGGTLTLDPDSKKIRDEALVTSLQGNVLYDFGKRQEFMWNTGVRFYNSAYQTYSKYNFMMVDLNTGLWWIGRRDIIKVPVGYREQYHGSERLSNIIHVDPSYEHYFCQHFSLRTSYSYNKEFFYNEDNASLENNTQAYELSPNIYLGNRRHIISGSLGYENRDADTRRFCYSAWYYVISYFTRFPTNTEFFFKYKWMEKDYKDKPLLYTQDREDRRHTITAVVSQQFYKYFSASLAFYYTDNHSNAGLYEFDKATYTINVGFKF